MLGAGASGPRQFRGRISVVPGGQDSPGWIWVPRAPPGPRFDGGDCWAMSGAPTTGAMTSAMMTDVSRMNGPRGVNRQSAVRESTREPQRSAAPRCRMAIPLTSPWVAQLESEELQRVALAALPERVDLTGVRLEPGRGV